MRVVAFVAAVLFFLAMAPLWASTLGIGPPPAPAPGLRVEIGSEKHLNVLDEGTGTPVILVHGRPGSAYDARVVEADRIAIARYYRDNAWVFVEVDPRFGYSEAGNRVSIVWNLTELDPLLVLPRREDGGAPESYPGSIRGDR